MGKRHLFFVDTQLRLQKINSLFNEIFVRRLNEVRAIPNCNDLHLCNALVRYVFSVIRVKRLREYCRKCNIFYRRKKSVSEKIGKFSMKKK